MKNTSRRSKFAGLAFATALGVMAFGATVAHAEPGAQWKVNGAAVTNELKVEVQVTEVETLAATGVKEIILLTKTGATKVEILCKKLELRIVALRTLGVILFRIHGDECDELLNSSPPVLACKPHSPGDAEGLILSRLLVGLIKLHTNGFAEQVEVAPAEGGTFVTLVMGEEPEGECAIGSKFDITGKAFLKAGTTTEGKTETTEKLVSEGALSALLFGGNAATIDGSVRTALTGSHAGMKWSGIAG